MRWPYSKLSERAVWSKNPTIFQKHHTVSNVLARTSHTTASIKSVSADFSYKVMSPLPWHQSKTWLKQIPKSNQIFTIEISSSPLLSFVLFTKCLNHRLISSGQLQSCRPQSFFFRRTQCDAA